MEWQNIPVSVRSTQEEVQLSFGCALKSLGVHTGQLEALWVEAFLVPVGVQQQYHAVVPNALFAASASARSRIKAAMLGNGATTGDLVQLHMQRQMADLLVLDSTFKVEVGIITELTGEGTGERMKALVIACLPNLERRVDPTTAGQMLHQMATGDMFKLAERALQERVKIVQSFINTLSQQQQPDLATALRTPWLAEVIAKFQFVLAFVPAAAEGKKATHFFGVAAIEPMLVQAEAAVVKKASTLAEVYIFRAFRWLLTDEQWTRAMAAIASTEERMQNDLGESLRKRPRKGGKAASSSDVQDVDTAMQSCFDLFK
jgi:hypothetical protein